MAEPGQGDLPPKNEPPSGLTNGEPFKLPADSVFTKGGTGESSIVRRWNQIADEKAQGDLAKVEPFDVKGSFAKNAWSEDHQGGDSSIVRRAEDIKAAADVKANLEKMKNEKPTIPNPFTPEEPAK